MTSNFNKKKINFFPSSRVIKYLLVILFFTLISITFFEEIQTQKMYKSSIENISEKFNYQLKNYKLNSLNRVNKNEVVEIINKYLNQSIFLIPLDDISNSIQNLKWVKNVKLSSNLKNTIKVEIKEYEPIGIVFLNNQLFYFSSDGKIIDLNIKKNNENFIVFYGSQILSNANNFINIITNINHESMPVITEAYYINNRRWDVKLKNNIIINLSEKNIEESISNYIKLIEKFDASLRGSIEYVDLRNNEKAIIGFK